MTLELDGVSYRYGDTDVLASVDLRLDDGESVAVLGPSGCGKTTLVQLVAGHLRPTAGRIRLDGDDVTADPPEERDIGVVFQESTLFPHLTVAENVGYGLAAADVPDDRRQRRVDELLELAGLDDRRDAAPSSLSGGEKRRIELARALAPRPDVLVLDEPLSALDRQLKGRLRRDVDRLRRETDVTMLVVTHDQPTATALSDRLAVLHEGQFAGVGTPTALREDPPSAFVASFVGRENVVEATVRSRQPPELSVCDRRLRLEEVPDECGSEEVACCIPSDAIELTVDGDEPGEERPTALRLQGTVDHVAELGREYSVFVRLQSDETLRVEQRQSPPVGASVRLTVERSALRLFADLPTSPCQGR